jgi:hypothetical protein
LHRHSNILFHISSLLTPQPSLSLFPTGLVGNLPGCTSAARDKLVGSLFFYAFFSSLVLQLSWSETDGGRLLPAAGRIAVDLPTLIFFQFGLDIGAHFKELMKCLP